MKFLTTPESTRLGIPAQVQASGMLLLMGVILMYWSFALNFVFGSVVRIGAISLGCLFIGIAALLRVGPRLQRYAGFLFVGFAYFSCLILQSKIQGHGGFTNPTLLPYTTVAFILLLCGYLLGSERPFFNEASSRWIFVFCGIACAANQAFIIRALQSADFIGRSQVTRGDFSDFNPISVAFNTGCIAAVFLGLAFVNRKFLKRLIYFIVFVVLLLVMLASASRGAALWMGCTFVIGLIMIRKHRYFDAKQRMYFFVILLVALVAGVVIYQFSSAVSSRIDILLNRFSHLFDAMSGTRGVVDASSNIRFNSWNRYLDTYREWLLMGQSHYTTYPHNLWLEILLRFGLLGVPLLLLSIYVMARLVIDALRGVLPGDGEFVIIAVLFIFGYLSNLTSLTISSNRALFLGLGYFLGYYVSLKRRRAQGIPPNRGAAPARFPQGAPRQ